MGLHTDNTSSAAGREAIEPGPPSGRGEDLAALRRFLKVETGRLRIRHRCGLGGLDVARRRSDLVDQVIHRACRMAAALFDPFLRPGLGVSGCAVVALGGYGRRELAPGSDVDLLLLHQGRTAGVRAFVQHVLHLLWDAGLTVGHSFRSVAECVEIAQRDVTCRTAMAEARLVAGSAALFAQLVRSLESMVARPAQSNAAYLKELQSQLVDRHARYGRAVCLQEPNVKEGPGGLRDLHAALWWGRARFGEAGLESLRDSARLSPAEFNSVRRAYDFLLRVRNEAHFVTGRRTDVLTLELQPVMARGLGYTARRGLQASEILMRDYYRQAEALYRFCRGFLLRAASPSSSAAPRQAGRRGPFAVRAGQLFPRMAGPDFRGGPRQVLAAFALAQEAGLDPSDELKLVLRGSLHRFDSRFRALREVGRAFTDLLSRAGRVATTLRAMHETGVLGRLLPEFARVTHLVQHDYYHRYTVDEHSLRALEALDEVASASDQADAVFHELFREVRDPARLYLAVLLHDVGKGQGGGHVARGAALAERVCVRLRLDRTAAQDVVFLVRNHLLMSHLAQRRDLSEPSLVQGFLAEVQTLDRLNMLLLLTYADHRAVAPGVWNDWTAALLWDLYTRARRALVGEADSGEAAGVRSARDEAVAQLGSEFPRSVVERHFALMPRRYLQTTPAAVMARHCRLVQRLEDGSLVSDWGPLPERLCTELTVVTRDAHGLVARLAGALSAHGLDILSLEACTREDGLVVDVFRLREVQGGAPMRPERWAAIDEKLRAAVEGRLDVAAAMDACRARSARRRARGSRPQFSARFVAGASATCSVLEVRAEDRPGLVYAVASTLSGVGLDIAFATIATEKSQVLDVFYVTDRQGRKLEPTQMRMVEQAVLEALGAEASRGPAKEAR
jgi:[protein-PII] uridylyltransferase